MQTRVWRAEAPAELPWVGLRRPAGAPALRPALAPAAAASPFLTLPGRSK